MIARPLKAMHMLVLAGLLCFLGVARPAAADMYVLSSTALPIDEIELKQLRSIYKGRLSQVNGHRLVPMNIASGTPDRDAFLQRVIGASELDYTGYWHVRRYTGQGTPPQEVDSHEALFAVLKQNPERIGYLWISDGSKLRLPEGIKTIRLR
jgi:hypothetical protein